MDPLFKPRQSEARVHALNHYTLLPVWRAVEMRHQDYSASGLSYLQGKN